MLNTSAIIAELNNAFGVASATRGCPQRGALSPTLWSLVADELIVKLNESGYLTHSYAHDIVATISGKFPGIIGELAQNALNIISKWCVEKELSVNPSKTTVIPFTRKRKLEGLDNLSLFGQQLQLSKNLKYLGVMLDSKLTWNSHMEYIFKKPRICYMPAKGP